MQRNMNRKVKIQKIKKALRGMSFNIPIDELPDVPDEFDIEIITFICCHIEALSRTDSQEFLSYLMFVLSPLEYEELLFNLWMSGVDIDELSPTC